MHSYTRTMVVLVCMTEEEALALVACARLAHNRVWPARRADFDDATAAREVRALALKLDTASGRVLRTPDLTDAWLMATIHAPTVEILSWAANTLAQVEQINRPVSDDMLARVVGALTLATRA